MSEIGLIFWDFDGVLNRNVVGGPFVWADELQADLGIDPKAQSAFLLYFRQIEVFPADFTNETRACHSAVLAP